MAAVTRRTPFTFSEDPSLNGRLAQQQYAPLLAFAGPAFDAMSTLDMLRTRATATFDEHNPRHVLALETLWHCAFPGTAYPQKFERVSEQWKALGFQGTDPVTDLRGGGFLALEHLVKHVIAARGQLDTDASFPLALASISCTALLTKHFKLHPTLVLSFPGAAERSECSTAALRNLLELHHEGSDALQALHSAVLSRLAREWARLDKPNRTIMDFPVALGRTYRALCDATPPGWDAAASAPQPWLQAVFTRLEREPNHYPHDCCVHPGAALAVLFVLLRSLAHRVPAGSAR